MNFFEIDTLPLYWEMENAEKTALYAVLESTTPKISIEIGTKKGGSLQLISAMSDLVYCLDIDEEVRNLETSFKNVDFRIGDSKLTLPKLLSELYAEGLQPDFILIDGDHSGEGVKQDILNILKFNFSRPVAILMHDSFNPECRAGMLGVNYEDFCSVKIVDLNFVRGVYAPTTLTKNEMWGGFGFILIDSNGIITDNVKICIEDFSFNETYKISKHYFLNNKNLLLRIKYFMFRKFFLKND